MFKGLGTPSNPGGIEIPQHSNNCLSGYKFVVTGTNECLSREECFNLIRECGGAIQKTLTPKTKSRTVTTLLCGKEDCGEKKIQIATDEEIEMIDENELIRRIVNNSNSELPFIAPKLPKTFHDKKLGKRVNKNASTPTKKRKKVTFATTSVDEVTSSVTEN